MSATLVTLPVQRSRIHPPNDDAQQPNAKDKLKEAFTAAKVPAEIEV